MTIDEKLNLIISDQQKMQANMEGQLVKQANMEGQLAKVENQLTDFKVHLENIIDKNIKIIAEGHTDLMRKLDDALKVENEKELLLIRVSYLEAEVKQIKERLAQIA